MNLHLTYFGDNNFSLGKQRIRRQAEGFGVFKSIQEFGNEIFKEDEYIDFSKNILDSEGKIPKRGLGYWIWKSYIISKVLNNIPEDDVILYVDSGCELNKNGLANLEQYYKECLETEGLFFTLDLPEIQWTKMDTYRRVMVENDEYMMTRQIIATSFFMKNTPLMRSVVKKWKDICVEENGHYLDDSPSKLPNDPIFRENRHDQSILSLLVKNFAERHDFTFYEDDTYEEIWQKNGLEGLPVGPGQAKVWNTYGREFPIWATRNGKIDFTNCEV